MKLYESAIVAGVAIGGIYALIAIGVTQIFKVTRVLNFSHAGFVLWGAYLYSTWAPGPPSVKHMPTLVAALLAVLCTGAMGIVVHFIIFSVARRASNVSKIIASLGMFQVMLAAAIWIYGQQARSAVPLISTGYLSISKTHVTWSQIANLGVALAIALAFVAMLRYTRIGVLTRAVTEDPERAELLVGARRNFIGAFNWAISAAVGGAAGVLMCSLPSFTNDLFFTYFTVALLATMVGGLQSLPLTVLGGVVFGLIDTVVGVWSNQPNAPDAALFAAFVVYILLRRKWPAEITQIVWTRPAITREGVQVWSSFYLAVFVFGLAWVALSVNALRNIVWGTTGSLTIVYALGAVSLVPILGWTGQVSLATPGIMGISAFLTSDLMAIHGWPMVPAVLVSLIVGIALGGLLGAVTTRLGFVLTAIVTLAFTNASLWVMNSNTLLGATLALQIPFPSWLAQPQHQYLALAIIALVIGWLLHNLRESSWGTRILATKLSPLMVQSFGQNPLRLRIYAYAVSGAISAAAGITYVMVVGTVNAQAFSYSLALTLLQYAVIGGAAVVWGPYIAAFLFVVIPQEFGLARFGGVPWAQLLLGLVVVLLASIASDGIMSLVKPPTTTLPPTQVGINFARRFKILPVLIDEADLPLEVPAGTASERTTS